MRDWQVLAQTSSDAAKTIQHVIQLEPLQVVLMLLIVPVAVLMVWALKLQLSRQISLAATRGVVQLIAVGFIIGWVIETEYWFMVVGLLLLMALVAGFTAKNRSPIRDRWMFPLMTGILVLCTAVTLLFMTEGVIGIDRWDGRYLIPLGGMLLGNAMTACTLTADRLLTQVRQQRNEVETWLTLGATPWQSILPQVRLAVRAGLMPTINAMMIVGVVKLPGMMTGQILGGSAPLQAALYQLLILLGILVCDLSTSILTVLLIARLLFTPAWQIRLNVLQQVDQAT